MNLIDRLPARFFETRAAKILYRLAKIIDPREYHIAAALRDAIRDNTDGEF
jgi:hypothetical protein